MDSAEEIYNYIYAAGGNKGKDSKISLDRIPFDRSALERLAVSDCRFRGDGTVGIYIRESPWPIVKGHGGLIVSEYLTISDWSSFRIAGGIEDDEFLFYMGQCVLHQMLLHPISPRYYLPLTLHRLIS